MALIQIDDPDDERIADYRDVPDSDLVLRRGLFVAEGRLVVRRLLESSPLRARSAMMTATALPALEDALSGRPELPVYVVPQRVMDGVAGFHVHRGCLALGERPDAASWRDVAARGHHIVVLERVGNADNVGSVFRHAAAFGASGVLLGPACADPLYRKAIRTSMAASLALPFAAAAPWPDALRDLHGKGWATVALTPSAAAPPLRSVAALVAGRPVAVVAGHEGDGLSAEALDACTHRARIPTTAAVDSLNVATAAAIALYELSAAVVLDQDAGRRLAVQPPGRT